MMGGERPRVLVFDFDGVLVDSLCVRDEGFRQAFIEYGEEVAGRAKAFHVNNRGLFRRDKFRRIYEEVVGIRPSESQLDDTEKRFVTNTHKGILDAPFLPGVAEFCACPPSIPLYVVSAAPEAEVLLVARYKGISHVFQEILGGPIPKPQHLQAIMSKENYPAHSILFIGDALNDLKAALKTGCNFMGIVPSSENSPFPDNILTFHDVAALTRFISDHQLSHHSSFNS